LIREIAQLMFWEASADLPVESYTVMTAARRVPGSALHQRIVWCQFAGGDWEWPTRLSI